MYEYKNSFLDFIFKFNIIVLDIFVVIFFNILDLIVLY